MHTINVSDFRGLQKSDIVLDRIALIGGGNGQGKSSLAQAVAAVLTGSFAAGFGVKKNELSIFVRRGGNQSMAKLSSEVGSAIMSWPKGEYSTNGQVPKISLYAAGLYKISQLGDTDRAAVLAEYMKTSPTEDELKSALADAINAKPDDKATWEVIENIVKSAFSIGFDATEKKLKEAATKWKGAWQNISGRSYGSRVAQEWKPDGYDAFSLSTNVEEIEAELKSLMPRYDAAIASQAVRDTNLAELDASYGSLPEYEAELVKLQSVLDDLSAKLVDHTATKCPEPLAKDAKPEECPWCHAPVSVNMNKLTCYIAGPTDEEVEARSQAIQTWIDTEKTLRSKREKARDDVRDCEAKIAKAKADGKTAENVRAVSDQQHDDPVEIKERMDKKRALLEAIKSYDMSKKYVNAVNINLAAADVLAADGLRLIKLRAGLSSFNNALANMANIAKWKPVRITDELQIYYGDFPYAMCSESEKYRANIMLQIAMAGIDQSAIVVMDAADILDADGKNGLFALLSADKDRYYLVCMTASKKEHVPDLKGFGLGRSYWIANGITSELGG